jgi:hypothetical protein
VTVGLVSQQGTSFGNASWTDTFVEERDFTGGGIGSVTLFAGADRISAAVGSYTTTATANALGAWRGQIVAFR